jgi:tetratricopeptide (TPR) repeat protein
MSNFSGRLLFVVIAMVLVGRCSGLETPAYSQTRPSPPVMSEDDPAMVPILLWQLERGETERATEILKANLTRIKPRLEAAIADIDRQFDILGRFGAVSIYFGPGYGDLEASNERYEKLFDLYRKLSGDEDLYKRFEARKLRVEGAHLTNQGEIECGDHLDWTKAQELYETALDRLNASYKLAEELKDVHLEASAKVNIGSTLIRLDKPQAAIQAYNEGLAKADTMSADMYKGLLRLNLGNTYVWLGQPDKSLSYSQDALAIFRKMHRGTWEANALMNLGNGYLRQKDLNNAWNTLEQALEVARKNGEYRVYGRTLVNLGMAGLAMKKKEAIPYLEEAVAWYRQDHEVYPAIEREVIVQQALHMLSQLSQQIGETDLAEKYEREYADAAAAAPHSFSELKANPCFAIYMSRPAPSALTSTETVPQ